MQTFRGTLMLIGETSFLDNVLLVRGGDPATATDWIRNSGLDSGDPAVVHGEMVSIHTTPAIEMKSIQAADASLVKTAASTEATRTRTRLKKAAAKKVAAKRTRKRVQP